MDSPKLCISPYINHLHAFSLLWSPLGLPSHICSLQYGRFFYSYPLLFPKLFKSSAQLKLLPCARADVKLCSLAVFIYRVDISFSFGKVAFSLFSISAHANTHRIFVHRGTQGRLWDWRERCYSREEEGDVDVWRRLCNSEGVCRMCLTVLLTWKLHGTQVYSRGSGSNAVFQVSQKKGYSETVRQNQMI